MGLAHADTYVTPIDQVKWKAQGSQLSCELRHPISGYGNAVFRNNGGERLTFDLETTLGRHSATKANIIDAPAHWKQSQQKDRKLLADIKVSPGKTPIHLNKMTAYQLLSALSEGREPRIEFEIANDVVKTKQGYVPAKTKETVILSASAFQKPYQKYLACVDQLVSYTYDSLKQSTFYFDSGSKGLPAEAKVKLDAMAEYIKQDKDVYRIYITGHSDSKGGYMANRKLAEERMNLVKDYLAHKGVKEDLFLTKGYGDRMPIAPNKTAEGRAKNRRVEVKIYR